MNAKLQARIKDFNRRSEAAKADGYWVLPGSGISGSAYVADWDGSPTSLAKMICPVEEYESGMRPKRVQRG